MSALTSFLQCFIEPESQSFEIKIHFSDEQIAKDYCTRLEEIYEGAMRSMFPSKRKRDKMDNKIAGKVPKLMANVLILRANVYHGFYKEIEQLLNSLMVHLYLESSSAEEIIAGKYDSKNVRFITCEYQIKWKFSEKTVNIMKGNPT
jgi:hypothetical protein